MPRAREFEIIERYFTRSPPDDQVTVGIGDDAAILDCAGPIAVAVDMLVAGTHFPESLAPRAVGHRALAVNLSDLAAVAARPRWATLALSLPGADPDWLEQFAAGFFTLAERYGVVLIGGDTTHGPLTVTVGLIGEASRTPLLRSRGRAGDLIFVSGSLGDAAAGLQFLDDGGEGHQGDAGEGRQGDAGEGREDESGEGRQGGAGEGRQGDAGRPTPDSADAGKSTARDALIERFCYPEPRVGLGLALEGVAGAAIDISDGLVADLGHICAESRCGAVIDLEALPLSASLQGRFPPDRCRELALHGGDDYELCFTVTAADAVRLPELAAAAGTTVTEIGELTSAPGIVGCLGGTRMTLEPKGFVHF